jgi:hypothetical protein
VPQRAKHALQPLKHVRLVIDKEHGLPRGLVRVRLAPVFHILPGQRRARIRPHADDVIIGRRAATLNVEDFEPLNVFLQREVDYLAGRESAIS